MVQSGRYQNASEVLGDDRHLLDQREQLEAAKIKLLKQAANKGWGDIAAGRHHASRPRSVEDFIGQLGQQAADRA